MSLTTGQVEVASGGTILAIVPPGPGNTIISNGGTAVVYIAVGATVTATTGVPLPSGGVMSWLNYQGSPGGTLRAVAASGSASVGFVLSTSYGLPQPGNF